MMNYTYQPFTGFNDLAPLRVYQRRLPHWRQDGCTYFVTFRLADSIPRPVIARWREERERWLSAWHLSDTVSQDEYRKRYVAIPLSVRKQFERDQMAKPLRELDKCYGSCIFRKKEYTEVLYSALLYFDKKRLQCGDFVIMPNHVHWIVMPLSGFTLEGLLKSIKQHVSRKLGLLCPDLMGIIWQEEVYDRCIRDRDELVRTRDYIRNNPKVAHLKDSDFSHYRAAWL
ncbi:MAG: hypothetical protein EOL87_13990 [Spartobacteria bacterium]|nr:hypothetical protein [Spartobacteria bacterium]